MPDTQLLGGSVDKFGYSYQISSYQLGHYFEQNCNSAIS